MSDRPTEPTPSTGHAGPDDDAGDPRLTDLLAGALPADEAAALHAELAAGLGNPGASGSARAQEFRELQAAWQLFDALPAVTPSASLEQSVLDQIHRLASTSSSTPAGHQPAALRSVSHTDHTRTESTMERSTTSLPSLVTRLAAQLIVPLAAAAMLLLSVTVMFNPPAPHGSPTATSVESLRAGNPTADMTRHAQGGLKGLGAGQPAGQAGPVVLIDNTNDPINPFGAVSAPEPMNPPQASAPIAPEPMNPPSYRYRSMGSDWQTLNSNVALDRLNLEVAVPAGQTTTLTFGTARLTIDGGQHGNVVTLVPDPMAGMGDNGRANGVMIEALDAGRMYLEQSTAVDGIAGTIALRTTTAVASVGTSNVELVNDAAGNTQLSVAKGRIELAGLRADGGVADAVVHEGEVATISLLARPDVRKHLNASWIANWARTAAAQIDTRYENPLVAGASASAGSAAVGSLVSSDPDYADVPFIIDEHKVDVRIVDQMAVTTVEEVFENTTERTMEGVFWFPLPTDAAISQFSMWVRQPDGQTYKEVQGEWTGREEARRIYDEYKFQRRDPALLEWMEGNTFRMSIFPIFAGEKKRVKLQYTQILQGSADQVRYVYPLVSEKLRGNPVRKFSINVTAASGVGFPGAVCVSHKVNQHDRDDEVFACSMSAENYTPGRDFVLDIPVKSNEQGFWSRTYRAGDQPGHLAGFFTPRFEAEAGTLKVGRTIFMVDTSGSMNDSLYAKQLALLESMLANLGERDLFTIVTVDYTTNPLFTAEKMADAFVPATEAQAKVALAALNTRLRYGSTNLRDAFSYVWSNLIDPREQTTIVLLGDGIATQGEVRSGKLAAEVSGMQVGETGKTIAELEARVRLFPIAIGNRISEDTLNALATALQGRMIMAPAERAEAEVAAELMQNLTVAMLTDLTVSIEGDVDAATVYPAQFPTLVSGQPVSFVAQYGKAGDAIVHIKGRVGAEWKEWNFPVALSAQSIETPEVGRYWAKRAIDSLQAKIDAGNTDGRIRTEIIDISKRYSVSSRHTSLLVLENNEEFERWKIDRTNELALAMKPAEGEPCLTITQTSKDLMIQPEGSDRWIALSDFLSRHKDAKLKLGTRISAPFDCRAVIVGPDGQPVVLGEKSVLYGMDLPTASSALQEWQKKVAAAAGTEAPAPPVRAQTVSEQFMGRASKLIETLRDLQKQYLTSQRERIRKLLESDRDAARAALKQFAEKVGAELKDDEQRKSLAEQVTRFSEMIESDEDPLITWRLMLEYGGGDSRKGKEDAKKAETGMGYGRAGVQFQGDVVEEDSPRLGIGGGGGEGGAATGGLRNRLAPTEDARVHDADDHQNEDPAPRTLAPGDPADPGARPSPQPPVSAEPAPTGGEGQSTPDPARPSSGSESRGGRNNSNGTDEDGGVDLSERLRESQQLEQDALERMSRRTDIPDGENRPDNNAGPGGDSGPTWAEPADEFSGGHQGNDGTRNGARLAPAEELEKELKDVAGKLMEEQQQMLLKLSDDKTRAEARQRIAAELAASLDAITADVVLGRRTLPLAADVRPISAIIEAYTARVLRQLRSLRGPQIGDLQFAPEGARLFKAMSRARNASIADQTAETRKFVQAANGLTVFALDCSYTMREALTDAQLKALTMPAEVRDTIRTKFDVARYELINALGSMEPDERVAVLVFNRTLHALTPRGLVNFDAGKGWEGAVWQAGGVDMSRIASTLRRLRADDTSNIQGVFDSLWAKGLFDKDAPALGRTAYLITDGWASWSPDSTGYVASTGLGNGESLKDYRNATFAGSFIDNQERMALYIHTVGVGNHNAEYLNAIAEKTGASYLDTTAGHTEAVKTMVDETPTVRAKRSLVELRKQAKNVRAWAALIDWATSPMVNDNNLALTIWLAWAEVHPTNHVIYEEMGEWLETLGRKADALRAFSNIVEVGYAAPETHRYLGNFYRARSMWQAAADEYRLAREQAWHIAIAWFNEANVQSHLGNYEEAESLLYEIIEKNDWPARYRNIKERATRELIVLYQQLMRTAREAGNDAEVTRLDDRMTKLIDSSPFNKDGLKEFVKADMIVMLDWDTDGTDVDLWLVKDGNDAGKCFYESMTPDWGAHLHEDQTEGFGPEFITLPHAQDGKYAVKIHYYSSNAQNIRSYCHVKVIVHVGTDMEEVHEHHIKLGGDGVQKEVLTVTFGK